MAVIGASASPIKSIQRGLTTINVLSTRNVTINSVDLNKSFVNVSYISGDASGGQGVSFTATPGVRLTSSTNLDITGFTVNNTSISAYWEVIEYV